MPLITWWDSYLSNSNNGQVINNIWSDIHRGFGYDGQTQYNIAKYTHIQHNKMRMGLYPTA